MSPGYKKLISNGLRAVVTVGALWRVFSQITISDTVTMADGTVYTGELREAAHNDEVIIVVKDEHLTRHVLKRDRIRIDPEDPTGTRRMIDLGIVSLFKRLDLRWFALAAVLYPICQLIGAFRWRELMRVHDIKPGAWQCVRLTFIGFFWSLIFPGVTGGDLVKSFYIAKQTVKKAIAVLTVFLDRIVGLVGMAGLSGFVILLNLGREELQDASRIIGVFILLVMCGTMVFFSHRLRRVFRFEQIIGLLPFRGIITELDRAVFAYRDHKRTVAGALAVSLVVDVITVLTFWSLGQALHMPAQIWHYFIFVPVILMISSIPITLAGLGLMEAMFQNFFTLPGVGATAGSALALVILFRGVTLLTAAPGGLLSLTGVAPSEEMARELEESQAQDASGPPTS